MSVLIASMLIVQSGERKEFFHMAEVAVQVAEVLESALNGSHRVRVTLRRDARTGVNDILLMRQQRAVRISDAVHTTLLTVSRRREWGCDEDRTFELMLRNAFNKHWFVERMSSSIETIEVVESA